VFSKKEYDKPLGGRLGLWNLEIPTPINEGISHRSEKRAFIVTEIDDLFVCLFWTLSPTDLEQKLLNE